MVSKVYVVIAIFAIFWGLAECGPVKNGAFLKDPMDLSRDEMMELFKIDPEMDKKTKERVSKWDPKGDSNVEELGHYLEGDILMDPTDLNGVVSETRIWENGTIPYTFWEADFGMIFMYRKFDGVKILRVYKISKSMKDQAKKTSKTSNKLVKNDINKTGSSVSRFTKFYSLDDAQLDSIYRAMDDYTNLTNGCINFRPKTAADGVNFVFFTTAFSGCFALIGRHVHVPNLINYDVPSCMENYGTVQHEMFHMLGFYHEHQRHDRDDYVKIMVQNIDKGSLNLYNFLKWPETMIDPQGEEYDYGSVMHYSRTAFSIDETSPTIIPFNPPTAEIGQRVFLSDSDIRRLNSLYESECPASGDGDNGTTENDSAVVGVSSGILIMAAIWTSMMLS